MTPRRRRRAELRSGPGPAGRCPRPRPRAPALTLLLLAAGGVAPSSLAAQGEGRRPEVPPPEGGPPVVLDRARDAQRDFERVRRAHYRRGPWTGDACDENIGRFCLNHDEDEGWEPPPEAPEVSMTRARLISILDTAARVLPDEPWLLGQRVKYRVEEDTTAEALALLADCAPPDWWCRSLRGLAMHSAARHAEAEAEFDAALGAMAPARRCAWTDLSPLLEGTDASAWDRLACDSPARAAFEDAYWHLSDPLWLVPGRERRVEHLARRTWAELQKDAATGYGLPWGDDLDELTMRYGWPSAWDVAWRRSPGLRTDRAVQAHRPPEAQRFVVTDLAGRDAGAEPAWELDDPRPRSAWAPPSGVVHPLPHQVAAFRRDDRRLVVAAFDAPEALGGCPVDAGLFLAGAFSAREEVLANGTLPLRIVEPGPGGTSTIVGVEVRCRDRAGAARVRLPLPETGPLLSDILLLESVRELPGTLDAALPHARRRSTASAGDSLVVFWEWYGERGPAAALSVTLSLTRESESFLRKALAWVGLAEGDEEAVGIRWSEVADADAPGRSIALRLPDLAPGRYRLTLEVVSAGSGAVSSTREIEVVP